MEKNPILIDQYQRPFAGAGVQQHDTAVVVAAN